jgi:hypothetical protein
LSEGGGWKFAPSLGLNPNKRRILRILAQPLPSPKQVASIQVGTLADILSVLRRERARLFAKYGLKSMAVFGSATRDDFRPDSDVDIMVEFERPIGIEFVSLADELETIVQRKVDLVTRGSIKERYLPYLLPDLKYI